MNDLFMVLKFGKLDLYIDSNERLLFCYDVFFDDYLFY